MWLAVDVARRDERPLRPHARAVEARQHEGTVEDERERERRLPVDSKRGRRSLRSETPPGPGWARGGICGRRRRCGGLAGSDARRCSSCSCSCSRRRCCAHCASPSPITLNRQSRAGGRGAYERKAPRAYASGSGTFHSCRWRSVKALSAAAVTTACPMHQRGSEHAPGSAGERARDRGRRGWQQVGNVQAERGEVVRGRAPIVRRLLREKSTPAPLTCVMCSAYGAAP